MTERSSGSEIRPILPSNCSGVSETNERCVNQRGWLERVTLPLTTHVATREPVQLRLDDRR